ncbi:hypothetical protein [Inquilinus limosus]|uniref:hypothetical protein n=1 Tax=Inquilinus limosus TaxID=171674 RepID=UPI0011982280|nr:hypothetical protein [Inquilinus limosus]
MESLLFRRRPFLVTPSRASRNWNRITGDGRARLSAGAALRVTLLQSPAGRNSETARRPIFFRYTAAVLESSDNLRLHIDAALHMRDACLVSFKH